MRDILPTHLLDFLRDRYIAGVATAEASFDEGSADEDALTGALGQALAMPQPLLFGAPDGMYTVQVSYRKLRGRGLNAPERLYGADGIFQIEVVSDSGQVARRKGLPFQSKTNWKGRNTKVAAQAADIQQSTGGGIVVDFTRSGYRACSTVAAIEAKGSRVQVEKLHGTRPLGQLLGNDFLECRVGEVGLFYDSMQERFINGSNMVPPAHEITTAVRRRQSAA